MQMNVDVNELETDKSMLPYEEKIQRNKIKYKKKKTFIYMHTTFFGGERG